MALGADRWKICGFTDAERETFDYGVGPFYNSFVCSFGFIFSERLIIRLQFAAKPIVNETNMSTPCYYIFAFTYSTRTNLLHT